LHIHQLYQSVTAQIVADLENGTVPWIKPWKGTSLLPTNIATGKHYNGINIPLLWFAANKHGYARNEWLTYKQAVEKGAQVRKGEKGTYIVYTSNYKKDEEQPSYRFLKTFNVFNVEQVDGIATNDDAIVINHHERHSNAEKVIADSKADIRHGNYDAMYVPSKDMIFMPRMETFMSPETYYATIFNELGHYTAHEKRLNRDLKGRFGDQSYAAEELVAV
jgi:antirestriction protein ArdC